MADALPNPATEPTKTGGEPGLPVAGIVCIAIGGYIVVILILVLIRQMLMQRGLCRERCGCCGKEGELQCCECCVSCAESTNCCKQRSIGACLDACCPKRKQMDCVDIIMCECCNDPEGGCCGSKEPLCDCCESWCKSCQEDCNPRCPQCGNFNCACQCEMPECYELNCICFKIKLKEPPPDEDDD